MKSYLLIPVFVCILYTSAAQKKKSNQSPASPTEPTVASVTTGMKPYHGFFDFYLDEKQDKLYLLINQPGTEFLYIESLRAGVGSNDIGLDRHQLGQERIVRFERYGPKVLMVQPNYRYRAISDNAAEQQAVDEAFAKSVLWSFPLKAATADGLLVDATDFFLQDAHDIQGKLKNTGQGNYMLDKNRSAFYPEYIKDFPKNSEFEVLLTFTGQPAGRYVREVTPTASSITVRTHYSFVALPDAGYTPRPFDPRAGYFSISYYDYASPIGEPLEKRFITRHRLYKKNPNATISEAVAPIIYYMDPGTPEPIRSALMEGASWWNQAFEAAGYKNAFRVELLPDSADAMDVRYNMINWVHRATRGWSYGSSISDPRTGEIIKGHVILGSLRVRQDFLIAEGLLAPYETGQPVPQAMEEMALARLRQLAAHEVGHTLGLAHAYTASTEDRASVMDYPHPLVNIKDGTLDLSDAYDHKIGAYDKVSITYGYQDFPAGTNEAAALDSIIQHSLKAGLTFLSDQDARPAGSASPTAHLWDNGQDAAEALEHVLAVRKIALQHFGERNIPDHEPMALLEEALVPIYFFHRYQTEATAKVIGGVNYRYALRGDGQPIASLLTPEAERKALQSLLHTVDADVLTLPEALLEKIPPRPLGYRRHRELMEGKTDLTFDPIAAAETAADMTFGLLFHPARANRVVDHHARHKKLPDLTEIIDACYEATIQAPPRSGQAGAVEMAVSYVLFSHLAQLALADEAHVVVKAITLDRLNTLQKWLVVRIPKTADTTRKAFYQYLSAQITKLQQTPEVFKTEEVPDIPPGQPIGDTGLWYCTE